MSQNDIIISPNNLFLELKDKSIYDLIEEYLQKYKDKEKHHTYRAYLNDIYKFFTFIKVSKPQELGQIPFANLSKLCMDYIHTYKKKKRGTDIIINQRTLNRKAYALKKFFDFIIFATHLKAKT